MARGRTAHATLRSNFPLDFDYIFIRLVGNSFIIKKHCNISSYTSSFFPSLGRCPSSQSTPLDLCSLIAASLVHSLDSFSGFNLWPDYSLYSLLVLSVFL